MSRGWVRAHLNATFFLSSWPVTQSRKITLIHPLLPEFPYKNSCHNIKYENAIRRHKKKLLLKYPGKYPGPKWFPHVCWRISHIVTQHADRGATQLVRSTRSRNHARTKKWLPITHLPLINLVQVAHEIRAELAKLQCCLMYCGERCV